MLMLVLLLLLVLLMMLLLQIEQVLPLLQLDQVLPLRPATRESAAVAAGESYKDVTRYWLIGKCDHKWVTSLQDKYPVIISVTGGKVTIGEKFRVLSGERYQIIFIIITTHNFFDFIMIRLKTRSGFAILVLLTNKLLLLK
jgi:hypothetical protein